MKKGNGKRDKVREMKMKKERKDREIEEKMKLTEQKGEEKKINETYSR